MLKSIIAKLEMSGKEIEAVKILENAITKAQNEGKCHEAYETEMLLVEMLIYKVFYYLVLLQLRKLILFFVDRDLLSLRI